MTSVASPFSTQFIDGFVKSCAEHGMSEDQTVEHFRLHCNNTLLSRPAVFQGFSDGLRKCAASKAKMARYLTPELLSAAVDARIRFGDDLLSRELRKMASLPEPEACEISEELTKTAAGLSGMLNEFDRLPLNQKILIASLAGGSAGGLKRFIAPTNEDEGLQRGSFNRVTRGVARGAAVGAGAATGAAFGSGLAGSVSPEMRLPAMMMGGTMGGLAGHQLTNDLSKSAMQSLRPAISYAFRKEPIITAGAIGGGLLGGGTGAYAGMDDRGSAWEKAKSMVLKGLAGAGVGATVGGLGGSYLTYGPGADIL